MNKPKDRFVTQGYISGNHMVGNYVYSVWEKETGGIKITGDRDYFYTVLGWYVEKFYPVIYNSLSNISRNKYHQA